MKPLVYKENFLGEIIEEQNKVFLDKISPRNRREGEIIISKYDWQHSFLDALKFPLKVSEILQAVEPILQKREAFLEFMAQYL